MTARRIALALTLVLASATLTARVAEAQATGCYYNGSTYNEGDRVGGFVCRNGQWVGG